MLRWRRVVIISMLLALMLGLAGCIPHTVAKVSGPAWYRGVEVTTSEGTLVTREVRGNDWEPLDPALAEGDVITEGSEVEVLGIFLDNDDGTYAMEAENTEAWLAFKDQIGTCYSFGYDVHLASGTKAVRRGSEYKTPCPSN